MSSTIFSSPFLHVILLLLHFLPLPFSNLTVCFKLWLLLIWDINWFDCWFVHLPAQTRWLKCTFKWFVTGMSSVNVSLFTLWLQNILLPLAPRIFTATAPRVQQSLWSDGEWEAGCIGSVILAMMVMTMICQQEDDVGDDDDDDDIDLQSTDMKCSIWLMFKAYNLWLMCWHLAGIHFQDVTCSVRFFLITEVDFANNSINTNNN